MHKGWVHKATIAILTAGAIPVVAWAIDMGVRVAKLEKDKDYLTQFIIEIRSDIKDIKHDVKEVKGSLK